jgi:hypothetical protein
MPFDPLVALLVICTPLAIAATVGLWLALLGWFGLPVVLEWLRVPNDASKNIIRFVTPVSSWTGIVAVLVVYYLVLLGGVQQINPWALLNVDDGTASALFEWWSSAPLVWLILAVEGPLVLLASHGLPSVLRLLGEDASDSRRITEIVRNVLLLIGVVVGVIGHGWPVWIAIVEPDSLREHIKLGHFLSPLLLSFAPLNLVLVISLPDWLKMANDERAGVAKGIAVAMIITGVIGGVLSALYTRRYWWQ